MYVINDQLAPSTLEWPKPPENVLVVKKLGQCLYEQFLDILTYLLYVSCENRKYLILDNIIYSPYVFFLE